MLSDVPMLVAAVPKSLRSDAKFCGMVRIYSDIEFAPRPHDIALVVTEDRARDIFARQAANERAGNDDILFVRGARRVILRSACFTAILRPSWHGG